jgi:hypothetical protein
MYDATFFFVPDLLDRCCLSQRNRFVTNPNGSIDLYLQAGSPGVELQPSWLPAPAGSSFRCSASLPATVDPRWFVDATTTIEATMRAPDALRPGPAGPAGRATTTAATIAQRLLGIRAYIVGFPMVMMHLTARRRWRRRSVSSLRPRTRSA